tara:strand:+ start:2763 stop:3551 length:789 start_codon:yes stop_codon:yes gene_type:complete
MKNFKNKTILITGASSGIGESFANTLDGFGATLILTARSEDKLNEMAKKMNNAVVIAGDLSDQSFPKKLYEKVKENNLNVDILINNAGFGFSGLFLDSSITNYRDMLNVNVYSLIELSHLFLKDMVKQKSGGIINISSLASFQPIPYFSIYAATKSFVTSFTQSLHEEYREKGIRVLGVCPGYTRTNFNIRAQMQEKSVPGYTMTSQAVVNESLKAYSKGSYLIVNGKINRFARFLISLLPSSLSLRLSKNVIRKGMDNKNW